MAQNANKAWSDSARDSGYSSRSLRASFEIDLPTDALPEFQSAFRERDERKSKSQRSYTDSFAPAATASRPYAATLNRDYAARDGARVSRDPYSTFPNQRNSFGVGEGHSSKRSTSQKTGSTGRVIHAEAFQPMGSHSVASQKKNVRTSSPMREARRNDYEFDTPRNYRNSADYAERTPRSARQESQAYDREDQVQTRSKHVTASASKAQKREQRRRQKRHEQADKKFKRQFAGEAAAATDAGPRAAVTKAEMGSKQRRAMRAQQTQSMQLPFAGGIFGSIIAAIGAAFMAVVQGFVRWRTLKKTVCAVAIIALICVCIYTPAQQYYQTLRLNDQLEAEYKAIEERNDALGLDLATLNTREGVEARAHEQFGLVKEGEESANVLGLDYTYDHSTTMMAAIPSGSVEMPEPAWYTPLLDAIFGIEKDGA